MITLFVPRPRSSVAVVSVVLLAAVSWPLAFLQKDWLGWFPATMSSFLTSTVWGSVAICTSAAWMSSGVRHSGLNEWVAASARGVRGAYSRPLLTCATLACSWYTAIFAAMFLLTWQRADAQLAGPATLALVLPVVWASAFSWAAVGTVLGRFVPAGAAIPSALILSYGAYIVPAFYLVGSPVLNAALVDGRQWLGVQPTGWQLIAKLLLWCGLAVLFSAIATSARKTLRVGGWMCLAGLTAIAFLGSALSPVPSASDRVCLGDSPRVCTDRAHAVVLPDFQLLTAGALDVLPPQLRPRLLDETARTAPDVAAVGPLDGHTMPSFTMDRDATLVALGEAVFYRCPADGGAGDASAAALDVWWRLSHGISVQEPITVSGAGWLAIPDLASAVPRGQALASLSPADREAWFDLAAPAISRCALEDIEWP